MFKKNRGGISSMTLQGECSHEWENDPMFEDGTVIMSFGDNQEMRQFCRKCKGVRYVIKNQ